MTENKSIKAANEEEDIVVVGHALPETVKRKPPAFFQHWYSPISYVLYLWYSAILRLVCGSFRLWMRNIHAKRPFFASNGTFYWSYILALVAHTRNSPFFFTTLSGIQKDLAIRRHIWYSRCSQDLAQLSRLWTAFPRSHRTRREARRGQGR